MRLVTLAVQALCVIVFVAGVTLLFLALFAVFRGDAGGITAIGSACIGTLLVACAVAAFYLAQQSKTDRK